MHIKEMPRRVGGFPVLKGVFLGWLGHHAQDPGYFCLVLTYGTDKLGGAPEFRAHLMQASGLDKPWREKRTWEGLGNGEANSVFADHEKLAEWPEGK